jgi:hypothetical protein
MKNEVYKRKVDTADELLAGILDAAGCIKRGGDQLRRKTRHLDTRVAKCVDVDCGILGIFIVDCNRCHFCATNWSYEH